MAGPRDRRLFRYYSSVGDVDYLYSLNTEQSVAELAAGARDAFGPDASILQPLTVPVPPAEPRRHLRDMVVLDTRPGWRHFSVGQSPQEALDATYECRGCGRLPQEGCRCVSTT